MADENQKLQCENERLTEQLRKAELIIDVQKNCRARLSRTPAGPETPGQVLWYAGRNGRPVFGVLRTRKKTWSGGGLRT